MIRSSDASKVVVCDIHKKLTYLNYRGCFIISSLFIMNANKRRSVLTAQNADVAQTSMGVTYLRFMKCVNIGSELYMFTTDTFEHGQETSTFAFD